MKSLKYKSLERKSTFYSTGNGDGIMLFVRQDISVKLGGSKKLPIESFYVELNLREQEILSY